MTCDDTGSPLSMYSRTSVASSRRDRSGNSKKPITNQELRAYKTNYSPLFSECSFPSQADGGNARVGDLAVFGRDQFGHDAHGDFLWRDRADVEANGCVNALKRFL